jgi:hypothetical protein
MLLLLFRYLRDCVVSCESEWCNTAPCLLPLNQLLPLLLLLLYTRYLRDCVVSCDSDGCNTAPYLLPLNQLLLLPLLLLLLYTCSCSSSDT